MKRYDERGRLLYTPKTTREFLRELEEPERLRNLREAREGWTELCEARWISKPIRRERC